MPEWVQENILPIVISTVIPAFIGLVTVWLQLKSNKPVRNATISQTQQVVYAGIYDDLKEEIARLKDDYESKIAEVRQEFSERALKYERTIALQQAELEKQAHHKEEIEVLRQEIKDLKQEVEFANNANAKLMAEYDKEIETRDEAIKALQSEVARLKDKNDGNNV